MKVELQQLRYSSQIEIESIKSVIKVLKSNISEFQNLNSAVVESLRKSGEIFICRQQARDKQIESLESDIRKLKVELDKKDDITYSHKQHNNQDHNAGNWSQLHNNQDHTREIPGVWSQVQYKSLDINESNTPQNKPEILLIGTSNTKGIQPDKFSSSYVLRKKEDMTMADTEKNSR